MKLYLVADNNNSRYYAFARAALRGHDCIVPDGHFDLLTIHLRKAKKQQVDAIILSHSGLLEKLVSQQEGKREGSLQDWAGASFEVEGIKIIISRPFQQILTTDTGVFLIRWYVKKHFSPSFLNPPELLWTETDSTHNNIKDLYNKFKKAIYIAVDIETFRQPINEKKYIAMREAGYPVEGLAAYMKLQTASGKNSQKKGWCIPKITMIGYCGLFKNDDGNLESFSMVLHINSMDDVKWMRKFNKLDAPKICQNGGYEATHLIRYSAPLYNWVCDTFHLMHSWFAELPRTLNFISSMFLKNYRYWKDEASSNMPFYNAQDTYTTLWNWVIMVSLAPEWATNNYLIEFRKCFPAITCGLEGFLVDKKEQARLREFYETELLNIIQRLYKITYVGFNPSSSPQVLALMNALSLSKYKSSDDKTLTRFGESGNLEAIIADLITKAREYKKKLSTYINTSLMDDRLLYEINHGGTDTGRAASKASNLWVGTQIQNQDNKIRTMYIADEGWLIANCDGSQAESRTTAYISEDENLINTVETAKDFHTRNASLFFGIPEDEIVKIIYETIIVDGVEVERPAIDKHGNVKTDKSIRTLSKRINHGSNYNMAAYQLLQTMGVKNVIQAHKLLELDWRWGLIDTCEYLLSTFVKAYPDVKGKYYDEVIDEIRLTGLLVAPNGWTRKCFGKPTKEKKDKKYLNKYVAHLPQCTSAMIVDEAQFDFWLEYQIIQNKIRLKADVHDEIVYQVRGELIENEGQDDIIISPDYDIVKPVLSNLMARPMEVKGRTMIIPNDSGSIAYRWGDLKD